MERTLFYRSGAQCEFPLGSMECDFADSIDRVFEILKSWGATHLRMNVRSIEEANELLSRLNAELTTRPVPKVTIEIGEDATGGRDESPQRQAIAAAIIASEERFRSVVTTLSEGVVIADEHGRFLDSNLSAQRILGLPAEQLHGRSALDGTWDCIQEDGERFHLETFPVAQTLKDGMDRQDVVMGVRRPEKITWLSVNSKLIQLSDPSAGRLVVASFRDISDQKRQADELRESEKRQRAMLDSIPFTFLVMDAEGTLIESRITGTTPLVLGDVSLVGLHYRDFTPLDLTAKWEAMFHSAQRMESCPPLDYSRQSFGKMAYWEISMVPLRDYAVLATIRETTQFIVAGQRQRELAHLARLCSLGEMVAGISHEINQPLHAINNYASATSRVLATEHGPLQSADLSRIQEWSEEISRQSHRAAEIVRRFRRFANRSADRSTCNPVDIANDSVALAQGEIKSLAVSVRLTAQGEIPDILCDPVLIQQVLVNLITNGCDAMRTLPRSERRLEIRVEMVEQRVCFEVLDDGVGLPQIPVEQLFEAFVGTKPNGLGMGLAISKSIVEAHGGTIYASPRSPVGARFVVELPLTLQESPRMRPIEQDVSL